MVNFHVFYDRYDIFVIMLLIFLFCYFFVPIHLFLEKSFGCFLLFIESNDNCKGDKHGNEEQHRP